MSLKLDDFTKAYIVCALWSSTDDEGNPLDSKFDIENINPKDIEEIKLECLNFQKENIQLLESAHKNKGYTLEDAGHDLWLTRNGHGAGFWDRNLGEIGEQLTLKSKELKESDLYVGDDGQLYFSNLPSIRKSLKIN